AVAVGVSASAPAGQALVSCGASPRGFGVIRDFSLVNDLIRPRQQRRRDRQAEDLRGLFVLPFALRLLGDLELGGGGVEAFRTSSTTSCHQCSAGALSSPSSRWRVSANCGSWCHASQFAWLLHVPTITLLSGLSAGRRLSSRVASEPSPSDETRRSSTTICPDCLVTRPKSPA